MTTMLNLADADERCGGKAATLGVLMREGFTVPPGIVVTDPTSDRWVHGLAEALAGLGPGPYAVRSSALAEDGTHASFAGQLHTTLNVASVTAVVSAVAHTAASGSASGSAAYASRLGRAGADVVPVLVQQMIAADVSGVLFTRHPVTGADQYVIEATQGLGDSLVSGSITPERWTSDGDAVTVDHAASDPALTRHQVLELAALGRRIEDLFGVPQDIEWAVADGQVWVLQARPITTAGGIPAPPGVPVDRQVLVTGTPGSPGRGTGTATVVLDLDDFAQFRAGDVLVCHATSPAWTPLLARAAAVVTETGGMLAHAAIVAREFGIPAVLAAEDAMTLLAERSAVLVDGDRGIVTEIPASEADR